MKLKEKLKEKKMKEKGVTPKKFERESKRFWKKNEVLNEIERERSVFEIKNKKYQILAKNNLKE